jgi:hypothetical protein
LNGVLPDRILISMWRNRLAFSVRLMVLSLAICGATAAQISREEGNRLQEKIDAIARNGSGSPVVPRQTLVSETELNSYLTFNLAEKMPKGLTRPEVGILGDGWLSGHVFVDLDEFKRQRKSSGLIDPFNYLSGNVPVKARGWLRTQDGRGQFRLESAEIRGVPLPKPLVQELVRFFSRTPNNPKGLDIDAPFELPAQIREILIRRAEAVIVQ